MVATSLFVIEGAKLAAESDAIEEEKLKWVRSGAADCMVLMRAHVTWRFKLLNILSNGHDLIN